MSTTHDKKQQALLEALETLQSRLPEAMKEHTFLSQGKTFELSCGTDCFVASSQKAHAVLTTLHAEARAADDYYKEFAYAKLLNLFTLHMQLSQYYAEFESLYPDTTEKIQAVLPGVAELMKNGQHMWDTIKKNTHV